MPRTYKPSEVKQYKKYDRLLLERALNEYNSSNLSLRNIAQKYKITFSVLHRHNTHIMKKQGGQPALPADIEESLVKYLNDNTDSGYPLKSIDFRQLIKVCLDSLGLEVKRFKNNMPGPDFITYFFKRHKTKITARLRQNIKRSRASKKRNNDNENVKVENRDKNLYVSEEAGHCNNEQMDNNEHVPEILMKNICKVQQPQNIYLERIGIKNEYENGKDLNKEFNIKEEITIKRLKKTGNPGLTRKTKIVDSIITEDYEQNIVKKSNSGTPGVLKPLLKTPVRHKIRPESNVESGDSNNDIHQECFDINIDMLPVFYDDFSDAHEDNIELSSLLNMEGNILLIVEHEKNYNIERRKKNNEVMK